MSHDKNFRFFPFSIGILESFRHILSPSISYSWRPDFSKDFFGIDLGYFERDNEGNLYDKFSGSMVGSTPKQEQKTVGMNLNNQFQVKVKDIENNYIKFDILTWNINTSYNFAADSLNLSTIRSSIRTTLPGGFNLDLSMTHDLYKLKYLFHSSIEKGGTIPVNNSQVVIDNPESVSRVIPPTMIINDIKMDIIVNHKENRKFIF